MAARRTGSGGAAAPPQHEFEAGAVGVGAWDPAFEQFEARREPFHQFLLGRAERGAVGHVAEHVVDREEVSAGTEPATDGLGVEVAVGEGDGAEQGVFEYPIDGFGGGIAEEIAGEEGALEVLGAGLFGGDAGGGRGDIEADGEEAVARPDAGVVAGAAARDEHAPAGQVLAGAEEVGEAGGALALFPWRVAGLVAFLPGVGCHDGWRMAWFQAGREFGVGRGRGAGLNAGGGAG